MSNDQVIACPACSARNRVDPTKAQRAVCGRCGKALPIATAPVAVTDANFNSEVDASPVTVLLDLWAPWCGPCRMLAPVLEELAFELSGRVRIAKLNVDENPLTSSRFNVRSIPTMVIIQNGREVDRLVGLIPKPEIRQRLERAIVSNSSAARGH